MQESQTGLTLEDDGDGKEDGDDDDDQDDDPEWTRPYLFQLVKKDEA